MKERMIKVAGLLLMGSLIFTVAYQNQDTDSSAAELTNTSVSAGISAAYSTELMIADEDANLTVGAGITTTVADYMTDAQVLAAEAKEKQLVTAAQMAAYGYTNLGIAQVDGNLNVREAPSTEASVVGKMPNNAGCEILEVDGEWTKISSGDVTGYVSSEYLLTGEEALAKAEEVKQTVATVTTTTLYVREEPNTDCTIITSMPIGEELEVVEVLDGWVKINVDSDEGYVSSDYVEVSTELTKAMTMTEVRYGQGVSDVRVSMVQYATQFVGNPYVWGGTSLTHGADCSGFVLSVYANYGISLPHSSRAQANCGSTISASEAKPGDLFFYGNGKSINHVAIYIGNGQVVHASSPKSGIKISSAYYRTPVKVVRIINE